jgi:hypothetical protein
VIHIEITAPKKPDAVREGRRLQTMYQTSGRVVRLYEQDKLGEHEVQRADVVIIVKEETNV